MIRHLITWFAQRFHNAALARGDMPAAAYWQRVLEREWE